MFTIKITGKKKIEEDEYIGKFFKLNGSETTFKITGYRDKDKKTILLYKYLIHQNDHIALINSIQVKYLEKGITDGYYIAITESEAPEILVKG